MRTRDAIIATILVIAALAAIGGVFGSGAARVLVLLVVLGEAVVLAVAYAGRRRT